MGSRVVELALKRGYKVVAFVHNHDLFVPDNSLVVKKGDIYDAEKVAAALVGSEAVVSCLSSWGTKRRDVLTAAMQAAIPAMEQANIMRIVTLTGSGAPAPDAVASTRHGLLARIIESTPAGKVFHDGENHMQLLAASSLDWTTIRSPFMSNFGMLKYRLNLKTGNPLATIKRQAVAEAMLDQLESNEYVRQAPLIHRK